MRSGGSVINFHEFLVETIDGIYFVIYLVKWLPELPPEQLRSYVLFLVIVLFLHFYLLSTANHIRS